MNELAQIIRKEIDEFGPITLARYMQLALLHPKHGYYVMDDPLGLEGDFVTAPEISQLFGEMIGVWLADMWEKMGRPDPFVLLELGPGRGSLLEDAFRVTAGNKAFHKAMRLHLLEANETLRSAQLEKLGHESPTHISDLSELPDLPLLCIANEFLDALPIHQYVRTDEEGWRERFITFSEGQFAFIKGAKPVPLPLPTDLDFYEISPVATSFVHDLSLRVDQFGGGLLFIDYGYGKPSGDNTFQAVSNHKYVNPLSRPGEVDLTSHVDFSALAMVGEKHGLYPTPIITQGEFLKNLGIELRVSLLSKHITDTQVNELNNSLHRLTDPEEMGTLFKVIAITDPKISEVPGFP